MENLVVNFGQSYTLGDFKDKKRFLKFIITQRLSQGPGGGLSYSKQCKVRFDGGSVFCKYMVLKLKHEGVKTHV